MLHTESSLSTYCELQSKMLELQHATLYSGKDLQTNEQLHIWKSTEALKLNSEEALQFINRLNVLSSAGGAIVSPLAFGIDSEGYAFLLLPYLQGTSLSKISCDIKEAKRLFVGCARAVAQMHQQEFVCGELAPESFWVGKDASISLIGLIGAPSLGKDAELLPREGLFGLPLGARMNYSSDIYMLGMIGAVLVLQERPARHQDVIDKLSGHSGIDAAFLQILIKCLHADPQQRFVSGETLVQALLLGDAHAEGKGNEPVKVESKEVARLTNYARSASTTFKPIGSWKKPERPALRNAREILQKTTTQSYSIKRFVLIGVAIFVIMLILGLLLSGKVSKRNNASVAAFSDIAGTEALKDAIGDLARDDVSLAKKTAALESLINSDDPVAHASLVQRAVDAPSLQERGAVEDAILERAKRLGLVRAKEQVKQWLKTYSNSTERPAAYLEVLKSLDPSIPIQQRGENLRAAFNSDPRIIVRLTTALALDTNNLGQLGTLLSEFLSTIVGEQEVRGKGVVALILGSTELSTIYGEDVTSQISTLNDSELIWVFKQSMMRRDALIQPLGQLLLQRNILPALRRVYLDIMISEPKVPSDVEEVVAAAVVGKVKPGQLTPVSRWYDPRSMTMLTAILADSLPDQVRMEAVDIIAARDPHDTVTGALLTWIKKKNWDKREQFIHALGVVSLPELFDDKEIDVALTQFQEAMENLEAVTMLSRSPDQRVIASVVERKGSNLPVADLFKLLIVENVRVRIAAVRALSGNNNIGVLKTVMELYTTEKDPTVRKVYRESFWMLADKQ